MDTNDIRDRLATYFEAQSRWRADKAAEFPDDRRNRHAEAAFRVLAKHTRTLPATDALLVRTGAAYDLLGYDTGLVDQSGIGSEKAQALVQQYGFHDQSTVGEFLRRYVETAIAELVNDLDEREFKVLEDRLRRMALRQGLALTKSRRRDPQAIDYGTYYLTDENNNIVSAERMDIGDLMEYLTVPTQERAKRTHTVAAIIDISMTPDPATAPQGMWFEVKETDSTNDDGLTLYAATNGFTAAIPDGAPVGTLVRTASWPGQERAIAGRQFVVIE